jgi:hypothetical protein
MENSDSELEFDLKPSSVVDHSIWKKDFSEEDRRSIADSSLPFTRSVVDHFLQLLRRQREKHCSHGLAYDSSCSIEIESVSSQKLICICYCPFSTTAHVYDTQQPSGGVIPEQLSSSIRNRFTNCVSVQYSPCMQQISDGDNSPLTIAFAESLARGADPSLVSFSADEVRADLITIFMMNFVFPFRSCQNVPQEAHHASSSSSSGQFVPHRNVLDAELHLSATTQASARKPFEVVPGESKFFFSPDYLPARNVFQAEQRSVSHFPPAHSSTFSVPFLAPSASSESRDDSDGPDCDDSDSDDFSDFDDDYEPEQPPLQAINTRSVLYYLWVWLWLLTSCW